MFARNKEVLLSIKVAGVEVKPFALGPANLSTKRSSEKEKAKEADRSHVSLDNVQIENVYQFVYLGTCFQSDCDSMADVNDAKHRMNLAQSTFSELHHLWRDPLLY